MNESFEEYYESVITNIPKNVLVDSLKLYVEKDLSEVIFEFYYRNIKPTQAVIMITVFLKRFKKYIKH